MADNENEFLQMGVPAEMYEQLERDFKDVLQSMVGEKTMDRFRNEYEKLYTIADYRREFNDKYCTKADVLVWGETDMLVPKQAFTALDGLHASVVRQTPKYVGTFSICKMWDVEFIPISLRFFT